MNHREGIIKFESERIKTLQEERLHIQKKTFTKWMNSFLTKAKMEVEDLFRDLADGIKLLKLLEIISSEKLGKPNSGRMRVHRIENVNKSLAFLHTKVRLESIGAEDIVDGNPRLTLGLIWTIILRFQIQEIEIDVDEENESSEKRSAKDALLLWCQRKTHGYQSVNIQDFTASWRSGLGFNALIHAHRPDLFDYSTLINGKNIDNLNHAFDAASCHLGIPRLLDAEDVDTARPDEKSILTYIASYYHTFARMKNEQKSGKRIANIVGQLMDADKKKVHYERLTSDLLSWIRQKTQDLEKRDLPNSLDGIQKELLLFKEYRTIEKPPKYKERSEIEALYFTINTLLKSLNQSQYIPQDGQLVNDIEKAWQALENAEYSREVVLREELLRQEKLEQLNYKFEKKSVLREGYLMEMIQVLSDPRYLREVDATLKKHEAISADILARKERFNDLSNMANELEKEGYHGKERVKQREQEVTEKWHKLLNLLENHKNSLSSMSNLMNFLREIDMTVETVKDLKSQFSSEDVGPHLLGVEELLQTHSLQEMQVNALGEAQKRFTRQSNLFKSLGHTNYSRLMQNLDNLKQLYEELVDICAKRRDKLEEARHFYHFMEDYDNEEGWLVDKQRVCRAGLIAKDLRAVLSLQQKHKALEDEMKVRRPKSNQMAEVGKRLVIENHPRSSDIEYRINSIQEHWKALEDLVNLRKKQLDDAAEAYQFYTDVNEAESWLNEKMALVASHDYGADAPSAQALLQRHRDLVGEINAYSGDILNLNQQADKLLKAGICTLDLSQEELVSEIDQEEWVNETRLVPSEVWEEEPIEKLEHRKITETKLLPHVRAMYPFKGQGITMEKGEVMMLKSKTNNDWWCVRKENGVEGFVPANYVREIEPRPVTCLVPKAEKVKVMQKIKKTILVRQIVPVKRIKPTNTKQITTASGLLRTPSTGANENVDSVQKRRNNINETYEQLHNMSQKRYALLEDSICLYGFYGECDDFEKWIKDKYRLTKSDDVPNVESAKRKFEKLLTDLSAASRRIEAIDRSVKNFAEQGHSQLDKIVMRQKQIHVIWEKLNNTKSQKEKSLEGASSVELFNRTCDEASDWMNEKMLQLDTAVISADLRTIQALQRKHQNLERELAPVEEIVNRVNFLANSVKKSYPAERPNVNARQKEVQDMWHKIHEKAVARRARIENAVGQQIFNNSAEIMLRWITQIKDRLNSKETARDVATATNLLKKHNELGDEIMTRKAELSELIHLGSQLTEENANLLEVRKIMERLAHENNNIYEEWSNKQQHLEQCVELQAFNREADKIEATTKGHEAFLEHANFGNSLDEVEAVLKRHVDFENTLAAQDKTLKMFSDQANKLIANGHYDAKYIDQKRNQVLAKRSGVKEFALERQKELQASRDFHKLVAEVEDINIWLDEKMRIAGDENYRDLSNLPRKVQKHQAFERELRANQGQLNKINRDSDALVAAQNRPREVENLITKLNKRWKDLLMASEDKGRKLNQALLQREHNRSIEDAKQKLSELKQVLESRDLGSDMRSCKNLINKHQLLESEITLWEQKIGELVSSGEEMAQEGHFDAKHITDETRNIKNLFQFLREPITTRRAKLEESLNYHKFVFELDSELQWIKDHLPAAASSETGQNLHTVQSLDKKHRKLEAEINGHESMIKKALNSGETLINQNHPEKDNVVKLSAKLEEAWYDLRMKATERSKKLELALKAQQYLSESLEIEIWLTERNNMLRSTDYGRDRDSTTKLLTKHKAIELELDTYSGIVSEMKHVANAMVAVNHPDSKIIAAKQQLIEEMLKSLQKLLSQRQIRLMESLYKFEYLVESYEIEQWIKEQEQAASSEDYGQDYEHLLLLQNKFDDFKHRVEVGAERFNQCEIFAKKLLSDENQYTAEIDKRQQKLKNSWKNLLMLINQREQKLHAAGEIHRFHRDIAEALFRIQDKNAALSLELGKDLNSALSLYRKHESFENDLVALEAQLQILVEDSVRLQSQYPSNSSAIAQQQETVVSAWNNLKENSALRTDQLAASCDLQSFLTDVRDIMSWSASLRATLQAEEHVSDAVGATALKIQHDAIYGEIEAREEKFRYLNELSDSMVQTGHYAAAEVEEKCAAMLDERQKLHAAWNKKKIMLEQKIDLFCFLRDAKQIENLCATQLAALSTSEFGQTFEDVQNLIKKHDEFEKLYQTQEEKVCLLQEHGRKLIDQNHYDSNNIQRTLEDVIVRRRKVKDLCNVRKTKLEDALMYTQFVRDCAEAESWITEKKKKIEADAVNHTEVISLEEKIKKLQKHQALQAEITANQGRIEEIQDMGNLLIRKQHESSKEIQVAMEKVIYVWTQLIIDLDHRGRGLEEAQDILEFNNQLEKIEAWIRDKQIMIHAGETGRDLEHCNALIRKINDVDSDMRVDDLRVKNINNLADKLLNQGQVFSEMRFVEERRQHFNKNWKHLQAALTDYKNLLAGAFEIHLFYRHVDDTLERIAEKTLGMSSDDIGRDLVAVETLIRRADASERDMSVIKQKISEHEHNSLSLKSKYPEKMHDIDRKLNELKKNWNNLQELNLKRRDFLSEALKIHRFVYDVQEMELWVNNTIKKMRTSSEPTTISECESLLELHQERKAEIEGRDMIFAELKQHGEHLIEKKKTQETLKSLQILAELHRNIHNAWDMQANHLKHIHQVQIFKVQKEHVESWLSKKEAFLNNDDLGDSFNAVEKLIKKHEAFQKLLSSDNVEQFERFAMSILASRSTEVEVITDNLRSVLNRKEKLIELSNDRMKKLYQSRKLQQFLRNLHEIEKWLALKMQIVHDENYRDASNLQSKIQKHNAFDAQLSTNASRMNEVFAEGEELIESNHYAKERIQKSLETLRSDWDTLQKASKEKQIKLTQAFDALSFTRSLDEFNNWVNEVEVHLSNEDYGKDLPTVGGLLKKHERLEIDFTNHAEICAQLKNKDQEFLQANHFLKHEIHECTMNALKRYNDLHEPLSIRRENLEDSLVFQQFCRDADEEIQWLNEKIALANSENLGSSLTVVQALQKKHQALEGEILSQEHIIVALMQRGKQMIRDAHFASEQIQSQCNVLQSKIHILRDAMSIRRLRLLDAFEGQLFYLEANEAELWMKEKKPALSTQDCGKDEDSVQTFQRKLEAIQRELVAFRPTIDKVCKLASSLVERNHFDRENIEQKSNTVYQTYSELLVLTEDRDEHLKQTKKFYEFLRESNEVHEWINDQMVFTACEDYGEDVEHVEQLIVAFESFVSNLTANGRRIEACLVKGRKLFEENNHYKAIIQAKLDETTQLWNELKDLVNARQEALDGAKKVHVYDRTADETILLINEKESSLMSEDYGQDLETIQALSRKHVVVEAELVAVQEQVDSVLAEAVKLCETYPDAKEHIEVKKEEVTEAWYDLYQKTSARKVKLQQAEQLQSYFDEYCDLIAWINEMLAKITAPDPQTTVYGAESLLRSIKEHRAEICARDESFERFRATGEKMINDKHFLAHEIEEKIHVLNQRVNLLHQTLEQRREIYELNLDTTLFLKDTEVLNNWISSRETILKEPQLGDSIHQVEDLLRRYDDFQKTVAAQEEKFHGIQRVTLIEQKYQQQKQAEQTQKLIEKETQERARIESIKQKEILRLNDERQKNLKLNQTIMQIQTTPDSSLAPPPFKRDQFPNRSRDDTYYETEKPMSPALLAANLRRSSAGAIKRSESMKAAPKQPKHTPSFNTRRRAQSFRKNPRTDGYDLPPVEIQGFLERKHELQSGGKKSPMRSWKTFHTVLCGQLLCFFKDENDFMLKKAATAPVNVLNAKCNIADDYTKKKFVFRLKLPDHSEFLFGALSFDNMNEWVNKISFHASLPPNLQLLSYDESMKQSSSIVDIKSLHSDNLECSPVSSQTSSPEAHKRSSMNSSIIRRPGSSENTSQPNITQTNRDLVDNQRRTSQVRSSTNVMLQGQPVPVQKSVLPMQMRSSNDYTFTQNDVPGPMASRYSSADIELTDRSLEESNKFHCDTASSSDNGSHISFVNQNQFNVYPLSAENSSENEVQSISSSNEAKHHHTGKEKDKRSSMFRLFQAKKKRASQ